MSSPWVTTPFAAFLTPVRRRTVIDPDKSYKMVTLPLYGKGARLRKECLGAELGTSKFEVRTGDLMISKIDARKGSNSLLPPELDGAIVTGDFLSYTVDESVILKSFFDIIVRSPVFADLCDTISAGSTNRVRLETSRFLDLTIELPSLEEQQRIVDLIGSLDEAIESADQNMRITSEAMREYLRGIVYSKADEVPISSFCNIVYGKTLKAPDRDGGTYAVFGAAGAVGSHSSNTSQDRGPVIVIGRKGVDSRADLSLPLRETPPGTSGWGGAGSVNYSHEPIWVIDTAYQVVLAEGVDPRAAYWSLVLAELSSACTATTLPGLNRDTALASLAFNPRGVSGEHLAVLDSFEDAVAAAAEERLALTASRAELLTVLLSGEHEIPGSYDVADHGVAA